LSSSLPKAASYLSSVLRCVPKGSVLVYVSVTGMQNDQYIEENYVKKFYPKTINGFNWSAIQLTTASGICTAVDLVITHPQKFKGFVRQEQFSFDDFTHNRFGDYYL